MKIDRSIKIEIDEGVYSPDHDTYLLLDIVDVDKGEEVLEIGSGSGIISLHCSKKGPKVTAVDKDEKALENTNKNAELNDIELDVKRSDLFSDIDKKFDVIIFNPPYLPKHEDLEIDDRWDGGERGDEVILQFLKEVKFYLNENGRIYLCFSDMAPLDNINSTIEQNFEVENKEGKNFRFETLYVYKLKSI